MRRRALMAAANAGGGFSLPIYIDDYDSCSGNICTKNASQEGVILYEFLRDYIQENGENPYGSSYELLNDGPLVISQGVEFNIGVFTLYDEKVALYSTEQSGSFYIYIDGHYIFEY